MKLEEQTYIAAKNLSMLRAMLSILDSVTSDDVLTFKDVKAINKMLYSKEKEYFSKLKIYKSTYKIR